MDIFNLKNLLVDEEQFLSCLLSILPTENTTNLCRRLYCVVINRLKVCSSHLVKTMIHFTTHNIPPTTSYSQLVQSSAVQHYQYKLISENPDKTTDELGIRTIHNEDIDKFENIG